ncbi:MAG: MFS transporter, partial [Pseudomonadota bacterium]
MTTSTHTSDVASSSSAPLVAQRRFWPMWSAFTLGVFADNMLRQALLIGIPFGFIALPGVSAGVGVPIIGALFAVAMLTFSSIAGQVADKYETAAMLRRTKLVEVCIMAVAALGFLLNSGHLLVLALFAMGAQSAFFSPVRIGAMPKYFETNELIRANAFFSAGLFVAILSGLTIGGMLITHESGRTSVAGLLFGAAFIGWLFSRKAPPAAATAPDLKLDWNIFRQGREVLGYAFGSPGVVRPMLGFGLFYYISTFVTVFVTVYAPNALGADQNVTNIIMALFTFGAGVGAISASALAKGRSGLGFSTLGI